MWEFNEERVRLNAQQATTQDLIDRLTAFRAGLEPKAIAIFEDELRRRGVSLESLPVSATPEEPPHYCTYCKRPAIRRAWGWHWMFGKFPLFPRLVYQCEEHANG